MRRKRPANAVRPPTNVTLPAPVLLHKYGITTIDFVRDSGHWLYESCARDCHTVTTVAAHWYFNRPVVRITSGDGDALIKLEWNGEGWDKV